MEFLCLIPDINVESIGKANRAHFSALENSTTLRVYERKTSYGLVHETLDMQMIGDLFAASHYSARSEPTAPFVARVSPSSDLG